MITYREVYKIAKNFTGNENNNFKRIGKNVNKEAYEIYNNKNTTGWVLLYGNFNKIKEEVGKLKEYSKFGIIIPDIGEGNTFEVNKKGFYLEEYIEGFQSKNNEIGTDINVFCTKIFDSLKKEKKDVMFVKRDCANTCMDKLLNVFNHHEDFDTPDLQFMYQISSGKIVVLDPGDKSSGFMRKEHLRWIMEIKKMLGLIR